MNPLDLSWPRKCSKSVCPHTGCLPLYIYIRPGPFVCRWPPFWHIWTVLIICFRFTWSPYLTKLRLQSDFEFVWFWDWRLMNSKQISNESSIRSTIHTKNTTLHYTTLHQSIRFYTTISHYTIIYYAIHCRLFIIHQIHTVQHQWRTT